MGGFQWPGYTSLTPNGMDNMYRLERGHKVFMMTEFLHGLYDRGQGEASKDYGQSLRQIHFFCRWLPLWAYVDEAVRRTDTGQMDTTVLMLPMVLGANREKEGSFLYCSGGMVTHSNTSIKNNFFFQREIFYVTNDYLFSNLSECRMKWKVMRLPIPQVSDSPICLAEGGVLLPAIQPGERGIAHFDLPEKFFNGDILELEAYNVAGGI